MEHTFYTLHDLMVYAKGWTYVLMGVGLLVALGFWRFLTEREEKQRKY